MKIADALARDDLDDAYLDLDSIDFSTAVLSREPHRLLVIPDAASGWTDLGNPDRVIETLIQRENEPSWLREMCGCGDPTLGTSAPTPVSDVRVPTWEQGQ